MYLDFTRFAKQDSDWLRIPFFISMFGYKGGLDGKTSLSTDKPLENYTMCSPMFKKDFM